MIEEGGTGPWKSVAVEDASLPTHTIYRPQDLDYGRIKGLPVVKISTLDGHHGTYYEKHAGAYAVAARLWLNWQLKGILGDSALFLNDGYGKALHPDWTFDRKGW